MVLNFLKAVFHTTDFTWSILKYLDYEMKTIGFQMVSGSESRRIKPKRLNSLNINLLKFT